MLFEAGKVATEFNKVGPPLAPLVRLTSVTTNEEILPTSPAVESLTASL